MAQSNNSSGDLPSKQQVSTSARLILQDPMGFDQATQPTLRSTLELVTEPGASLQRENARELWEHLSLEPEIALERKIERKRLLARADQLARDTTQAKAQAAALQTELATAREERLQHPVVYAGAAGLLGLGALWWLERRKRSVLESRELAGWDQERVDHTDQRALDVDAASHFDDNLADATSVFTLENAPDLVDEIPSDSFDPILQTAEFEPVAYEAAPPTNLSNEEDQPFLSTQKKDPSLLVMSKRVLGNVLGRRSQSDALGASQLPTERQSAESLAIPATHQSEQPESSTQFRNDTDTQFRLASDSSLQQASHALGVSNHSTEANVGLLTQVRAVPFHGESVMEHLLELRMAVNGLRALGRPKAATHLLQAHIVANPDTCAWAYLECMHLCEQLDRRDEFESMRQRYRLQFNRMAPYWHEPNANVIGLDGYARATGELCAAWAQGREQAYAILTLWLAGPLIGRKLVQLPAYHDLFDLYELLEFLDQQQSALVSATSAADSLASLRALSSASHEATHAWRKEPELEFVPTVNLLDLDYEFSSDVTLQEGDVAQSETAVTIVKPGNFSVDFNVTGTQLGGLFSVPAELDKK